MKNLRAGKSLPWLSAGLVLFTPTLLAQEVNQSNPSDPIHGADHEHDILEEVVVTATPLPRNVIEMSQTAVVLSGADLDRRVTNNIGDTLSTVPGLSNASFGQNVGRPVIRGFQEARVGVMNNNMTVADASAVSQDHAVATEPFLADQIEVLKGPSTLLYGSGSIGGVVNVVTNGIPQAVPENGVEARAMIQGDSASDQRLGAARIDFGSGSFAMHLSGFYRRSDDYEIPGAADLYPDDDHDDHDDDHDEEHEEHEEEEVTGILENSFLDNEGGTIGVSWIGESWRVGASYTLYDSNYGIPGAHAHHHEEDEHEGEHEDEDHDEHEEAEEENVTIKLKSKRFEGEVVGTNPFSGFEQLSLRVVDTDYTHTEFEGAETGTVFDSQTTDLRLELRHLPWSEWYGAFGAQYTDTNFEAEGEEAFVPPSDTRTWALFWVESGEFGDWQWDLGVRYENVRVRAEELLEHDHHDDDHDDHDDEMEGPLSRTFKPFNIAAGTIYHLNDGMHLAANLSYAERAPTSQELFAFGPHIATQTFEVGDPTLDKESNLHGEIGFRVHEGQLTGSITAFYDSFDDYIFQMDTGEEEDGLPLRQWAQQDAKFYGGELELRYDFGRHNSGHWQIFGFTDLVRAKFRDDTNVPRIPPVRYGLGLDWDLSGWAANVTWIHASSHTRTAEYETPTPGYDQLNAEVSYQFAFSDSFTWEAYLKGTNLLDEDIRHSTSFLKDQAPMMGRNYILGLRMRY